MYQKYAGVFQLASLLLLIGAAIVAVVGLGGGLVIMIQTHNIMAGLVYAVSVLLSAFGVYVMSKVFSFLVDAAEVLDLMKHGRMKQEEMLKDVQQRIQTATRPRNKNPENHPTPVSDN